jgi:hypothetical protein
MNNKFKQLAEALKGQAQDGIEQTVQPAQIQESTQKRNQKKLGKRSDPNYELIGVYIPKEINLEVKRLLIGKQMNFSDLVTDLLRQWLKQQSS